MNSFRHMQNYKKTYDILKFQVSQRFLVLWQEKINSPPK